MFALSLLIFLAETEISVRYLVLFGFPVRSPTYDTFFAKTLANIPQNSFVGLVSLEMF